MPAKAVMEMYGGVEREIVVDLPFKAKIDAFAEVAKK